MVFPRTIPEGLEAMHALIPGWILGMMALFAGAKR